MDSIKESILEFSAKHIFLSFAIRILIGIVILIIVIKIIGLFCSFLYMLFEKIVGFFNAMNEGLTEICAPAGKSSNPWGMVIALLFAAMFFFASDIVKGDLKEFWARETVAGIPMYRMWGIVILGIILLTGLITAKLRLPLVLLAKLIRIPLDLISIPFRILSWITAIIAGITGSLDSQSTVPGNYSGSTSPTFVSGTVPTYSSGSGHRPVIIPTTSGYSPEPEPPPAYNSYDSSTPSDFSDGVSYFGEKHTDQFRNSQEGGSDGYYYGRTESGQVVYYSGDYRPVLENSEDVTYYHLDEDCAPME